MLALVAVGLALLSATGCNKLRARDQLNKGVQAYKNAKYEEAIDHFQQAVSLDPSLLNARLYLATAYAQQYIPGADTEDNNRMGQQAIDQYKEVLERDPKNINSVKGHRLPVPADEEVRRRQEVLPQGHRPRSQRSGALLLGGGDRLDAEPTSRAWKSAPSWA